MLVWARWTLAWVEFALDLRVAEFAIKNLAIGTVSARCGVNERAVDLRAIGSPSALLSCLVGDFLGGRWVLPYTLLVLAGSAERADVAEVDGCSWRCSWRLMCELAIRHCALQVESALGILRVEFLLLLRHLHIH